MKTDKSTKINAPQAAQKIEPQGLSGQTIRISSLLWKFIQGEKDAELTLHST